MNGWDGMDGPLCDDEWDQLVQRAFDQRKGSRELYDRYTSIRDEAVSMRSGTQCEIR